MNEIKDFVILYTISIKKLLLGQKMCRAKYFNINFSFNSGVTFGVSCFLALNPQPV